MIILGATPIGNLGDVSTRLRETLERVEVIASEDTRTTIHLMRALQIENRPKLIALHDHNEKSRAESVVEIAREQDVLILSDAGMPTISDPGFALVAQAAASGVEVTVIPGPSAVLSALAVSGLPTDSFIFEGFLPRKAAGIAKLCEELKSNPRTLVFFESPDRVAASLRVMIEVFGAERHGAICRELTKLHEEVTRGTLPELLTRAEAGLRGEVVLVVAGFTGITVTFADALAQTLSLKQDGVRLKDAAAEVSEATGFSRRELYQAALER